MYCFLSQKLVESDNSTKPRFLYPAIVFPDRNYETERRRLIEMQAQHTGEEIALASGV